jgi:hypothetical protein
MKGKKHWCAKITLSILHKHTSVSCQVEFKYVCPIGIPPHRILMLFYDVGINTKSEYYKYFFSTCDTY